MQNKLHDACSKNEVEKVRDYVKKLSIDEINHIEIETGNTALHIATNNGHIEIIKLLLERNPFRSIRNKWNKCPFDLAPNDNVRSLFKRENCFDRFCSRPGSLSAPVSPVNNDKNGDGCSLCGENDPCEWEIVDDYAVAKAVRFRQELNYSLFARNNINRDLKNKIYSINKGYLDSRLRDMHGIDSIKAYFRNASENGDPFEIVRAYSSPAVSFYKYVNGDMARNIIHDLRQGCSKFFCTRLYLAQDGVMSIASILLHHPKFAPYTFRGEVYRGMVVEKACMEHYRPHRRIVNTTFLSTSRDRNVAKIFSYQNEVKEDQISIFCTYEIKNDRTALYIAELSEVSDEKEVLILPFAAFTINTVGKNNDGEIHIWLEECELTQPKSFLTIPFFKRRQSNTVLTESIQL
ncbi:unnamed protein product [Didymodactylos carnosus]|uniref:ADP ribosyltransferase domain-containing protein n=1 Tax=Didymodactylos carnosus TaxID=1234261 RepID=A0A8S2NNJ4_9BILA|nr:unnamed protein product [Didymodactylos carnosus]CAF4010803.1 unnamed protein product [Didymodactylos carnosus]